MRRASPWVLVVLAFALALAAHGGRRAIIRAFFYDGAGPEFLPAPARGRGLTPAARTRVVVLDGLGREHADGLPALRGLCSQGIELDVDNGFPTVSLPVQHVLWTGLTQQQSGLWYRIPRLDAVPADSLAARTPASVAIAESHPDIIGSFGFASASPPPGESWSEQDFVDAASDAIRSDAALVLVHVLRIDEMGHAHGASAGEYDRAARWADDALAHWLEQAPPDARWFVLADHGHLPSGGHGGAEPSVRVVRACIRGGLPSGLERQGEIHLVDLSRALADSLGLAPSPAASGRPLEAAMQHPDPGATLPHPSAARWLLAGLLIATGLAVAVVAGRGWRRVPWWVGIAYAGFVISCGPVTLSNPAIYPPWGRDILLAAAPGFLVLAVTVSFAGSEVGRWRIALAQLVPVLALALAGGILSGVPQYWWGLTQAPPLMPSWTAHTSVALSLCLGGAVTVGVVGVAVAAIHRPRGGSGAHERLEENGMGEPSGPR